MFSFTQNNVVQGSLLKFKYILGMFRFALKLISKFKSIFSLTFNFAFVTGNYPQSYTKSANKFSLNAVKVKLKSCYISEMNRFSLFLSEVIITKRILFDVFSQYFTQFR